MTLMKEAELPRRRGDLVHAADLVSSKGRRLCRFPALDVEFVTILCPQART